jgi:serine/threonine-protein kinase
MTSKYRVVQELGVGGMGKVYKGLLIGQSGFQRPIVLKQLRDDDDPAHLRLFVEEARRYALLDHENIGRIVDFERVDGRMCIILEYIDGWSLVDFLEHHAADGRLPDVELTVFIVSRVCRALQYVYERAAIAHRDVSPSNIMMTREGTVKLIDFGIATRSGTRSASLAGTPAYMAPEMVVDLRADNRSDLFSLGAVFYEMLSLERLFGARPRRRCWRRSSPPRSPRRVRAAATCPKACSPSCGARCSAARRTATPPRPRWAWPASTTSTTRATVRPT